MNLHVNRSKHQKYFWEPLVGVENESFKLVLRPIWEEKKRDFFSKTLDHFYLAKLLFEIGSFCDHFMFTLGQPMHEPFGCCLVSWWLLGDHFWTTLRFPDGRWWPFCKHFLTLLDIGTTLGLLAAFKLYWWLFGDHI